MSKALTKLAIAIAIALFTHSAWANNVTGTITTPNTAIGVSNGTLTFNLSQAAIAAGSFSVTSSPVSCFTSTDGSVVGLPNPIVAPSVSYSSAGGTLAGTYYVKVTYYASGVETLASPAFTAVVVGPNNRIIIATPTLQPTGAIGYKVYVGTTLGAETLQATTSSFVSTTITSVSAGGALPSSNSSVCSISFNDVLIPFGTTYRVSLVNVNGSSVAGFPQSWFLAGASVNVSNGYPVASVSNITRFPTPVLQNPSSNAQQSVNSPVTLNGYSLTAGSLQLPDNAAPPACAAGKAVLWENASHVLQACQNGGSAINLLNQITNGWQQNGTDIREATTTNSVLVGVASSDLTTQGGGTSTGVSVGTFNYFIDATANAHVLAVGMLNTPNAFAATPVGIIGITASGTQTAAVPLMFVGCASASTCSPLNLNEYGRIGPTGLWRLGPLPAGQAEDGGATTDSLVVRGSISSRSGFTSAAVLQVGASGIGSMAWVYSTSTNGVAAKPMVLSVGNSGSVVTDEAMRVSLNRNLLIGDTVDPAGTSTIVLARRDQDSPTIAQIKNITNPGATASAEAAYTATSAAGSISLIGTPTGYTANGAFNSAKWGAIGGLTTTSGLTNGMLFNTGAGPFKFYPASVSAAELVIESGDVQVVDKLSVGTGAAPTIGLQAQSSALEVTRFASTGTAMLSSFYFSTSSLAGYISGNTNEIDLCRDSGCTHGVKIDAANTGINFTIPGRAGAPSSPGASSFIFYIDSNDGGKLKVKGSGGTVTTIAVP